MSPETLERIRSICDQITDLARSLPEDESVEAMCRIVDYVSAPDGSPC